MGQNAALLPLKSVLSRYGVRKKAWRDFVEVGLVAPAQKIPNTKRYGITKQNAARLARIATASKRIKGQRVTLTAIAFELARDGEQDPTVEALVKLELQKRVKRYIGLLRRSGRRLFGFEPGEVITERDVHQGAQKLSKRLSGKNPEHWSSRTVSYQFTAILIRTLYHAGDIKVHAESLHDIILNYLSLNHPKFGRLGVSIEYARNISYKLLGWISGVAPFLDVNKRDNLMYRAVTQVDDAMFWKCYRAGLALFSVVWEMNADLSKDFPMPKYGAKERATVEGVAVALVLAIQVRGDHTEDSLMVLGGDYSGMKRATKAAVKFLRILKTLLSLRQKFLAG